jgi:hypothetical protein
MKPTEIIRYEAEKNGHDANKWLYAIKKLIDQKLALMIQENDSILLIIQLGDNDVEIHLFTTDKPATLIESIKRFIQKVKNSEIRKMYIPQPDDPNIIKAIARLGLNVAKSDKRKYAFMVTL